MVRHLRSNVVAYLALFVSLGGTSYAALTVTSKNVKDRSLSAQDIKKDTLTGTEVREAKLGEVPRATRADTAGVADSAAVAGSAATAGDAAKLGGFAPGAFLRDASAFLPAGGKAADADTVDGVDSASLLRTSALMVGRADGNLVGVPLFTDPVLGLRVETDETAGPGTTVYLRSTRPPGVGTLRVLRTQTSVDLPSSSMGIAAISYNEPTLVIDLGNPSLGLLVNCNRDSIQTSYMTCFGVRTG